MIYLKLKKRRIGTFERILIILERRQYVLFFHFRKTRNSCQADPTAINTVKIQLDFLVKLSRFW